MFDCDSEVSGTSVTFKTTRDKNMYICGIKVYGYPVEDETEAPVQLEEEETEETTVVNSIDSDALNELVSRVLELETSN